MGRSGGAMDIPRAALPRLHADRSTGEAEHAAPCGYSGLPTGLGDHRGAREAPWGYRRVGRDVEPSGALWWTRWERALKCRALATVIGGSDYTRFENLE